MRGLGVTADTGFLIGLERSKDRALGVLARLGNQRVSVPVAVVAEWWRGSHRQAHVLRLLDKPEPMTEALAKRAGEAMAKVPGATTVDAIVMASAASRGDVVYTIDFGDLERLRLEHFRAVPRVFAV
jgi:predicted nucleic acid-binding protein